MYSHRYTYLLHQKRFLLGLLPPQMGFNPRQVTFTLFGAAWGAVQTRIIYKKLI